MCALPLLFLYSLVARFGDTGDVQAVLSEVGSLLDAMEGILENKIARAATMIVNGADEFRSQLGKARGSVSRATASGGAEPPPRGAGCPDGRSAEDRCGEAGGRTGR